MLGEVGGRGCLARTTFEIDDRDHLQLVVALAVRHIFLGIRLAVLVEIEAQLLHLLGCVQPSAAARRLRNRPLAFEMKTLQIVGTDAEIMGDLCHRKQPQRLLGIGWKFFQPQLIKPPRDLRALQKDLFVELETRQSGDGIHRKEP